MPGPLTLGPCSLMYPQFLAIVYVLSSLSYIVILQLTFFLPRSFTSNPVYPLEIALSLWH